ncbi:MAG: hypothetical protein AAF193_02220 [Bacteroidota bacterium]
MKKQQKSLASLNDKIQAIEENLEGVISGGFAAISHGSSPSGFARFANTNNAVGCVCSGSGSNTNQVVGCSCNQK